MVIGEWDSGGQRAAQRATARGEAAHLLRRQRDGLAETAYYTVGSLSRPGTAHRVAVRYDAAGVAITCDCEAALHGRVCWHAAAVARAERLVDQPQAPAGVLRQPSADPAVQRARRVADALRNRAA